MRVVVVLGGEEGKGEGVLVVRVREAGRALAISWEGLMGNCLRKGWGLCLAVVFCLFWGS